MLGKLVSSGMNPLWSFKFFFIFVPASTSLCFTSPSGFNWAAVPCLEIVVFSGCLPVLLGYLPSCQAPGQRPVCRDYASSCPALSIPARLIQSSCCFTSLFSLISYISGALGASPKPRDIWESHCGSERAGFTVPAFWKTWTDEPEIGWQENGLGMFPLPGMSFLYQNVNF